MKKNRVKIIGAGLAGCECALYLANHGVQVDLFEVKRIKRTACQHSDFYAELVCSNSLKSNDVYGNACGLLKEEMRILGSEIIKAADEFSVPAGRALAVNRDLFSQRITEKVRNNPLITCYDEEVTEINPDEYTVVATGPLSTDSLNGAIQELTGDIPYFFDAAAPILDASTIDQSCSFVSDRYGEPGTGDYVNCPLNKEEYLEFIEQLKAAKRVEMHDFENKKVFDGCMPVEIMAERGIDTLRFGPMKPAGLTDPRTGRWPYACVQLRKENVAGDSYNLVGFQTNLLFPEQKRVFSYIPALKNAEYFRYGVMHKNTYVNAPKVLCSDFSMKNHSKVYFAGQISGVEGYVESAASGLVVGINLFRKLNGKQPIDFTNKTVIGALSEYVATENENYQPMNANYGIIYPLDVITRDKDKKKRLIGERSLTIINKYKETENE